MKVSKKAEVVYVLSKRAELLRQLKRENRGSRKTFKMARSSQDILKTLTTVPLLAVWVDAKFVDQNKDALETALYLKDCLTELPIQLISEQASQLMQAIASLI
jgi:hypothetical protein